MKTQQEAVTTVKDKDGTLVAIIVGHGNPVIYGCQILDAEELAELMSS